ncbi:MAG: MIP family channel protein [Acidimicrobiia bacterium]|nr:MAG: MIP family channel protein [Acidimicrobiia bacterium]
MTEKAQTMFDDVSARKLLAELLGTYVLVLVGGTAILAATAGTDASARILAIGFGFGLALLAGLYAFGEVSGGHYNPAVSLAMALDGRLGWALMVEYWVAQILGAILAGFTLLAATSKGAVASTATVFPNLEIWEAILFEAVFTAIFVAVILKVTASAANSSTVFLAISLTLVAVHLALIPFTGASVNPARSLGSGVAGGVWDDQWVYWIAPLIGAVVGWGVHKAVMSNTE